MKKLLLLVFLLSIYSIKAETVAEEPFDTDGNGYINISTLAHLKWLSEVEETLSGSYELDNDIDASETSEWYISDHDNDPITPDSAMGWKPIKEFSGKLDGKNHSIKGLYINRRSLRSAFISNLNGNGSIINLRIVNAEVSGDRGSSIFVGIIIPSNSDSIVVRNCIAKGNVTEYFRMGGIPGAGGFIGDLYFKNKATVTIEDCSFDGEIESVRSCGGLIGKTSLSSTDAELLIKNCDVKLKMECTYSGGGLLGQCNIETGNILIERAKTNIDIDGNDYCGGLIGALGLEENGAGIIIKESEVIGALSGGDQVGAFIGSLRNQNGEVKILSNKTDANIIGAEYCAGFISSNTKTGLEGSTLIENCEAVSNISSFSSSAGFIALNEVESNSMIIRNCSSNSEVSGFNKLAGFISENVARYSSKESIIDACTAECVLNGKTDLAGFIAENRIDNANSIKIRNCSSQGTINASYNLAGFIANNKIDNDAGNIIIEKSSTDIIISGIEGVGGFLGINNLEHGVLIVDQCEAKSKISGGAKLGGFIAESNALSKNSTFVFESCSSDTYIEGSSWKIGGFIGVNDTGNSENSIINNCSSKGLIKGVDYIGGFVGVNNGVIVGSESNTGVEGESYVAGFCAKHELKNETSKSKISRCESRGTVKGEIICGGFCGISSSLYTENTLIIRDCFTFARVESDSIGAGFIAYIYTDRIGCDVEVIDSYACNLVETNLSHAGFRGISSSNKGLISVLNCYWDKDVNFYCDGNRNDARTSEEMKDKETYKSWDFDKVWKISPNPNLNKGYPYLRESQSVGIEENYEDREDIRFSIYPNPAAEYINFSFSEEYSGEVRISIVDILGREYEIYKGIIHDNLKLDISEFPVARYFVRVTSNTISETLPLLIE